MKKRILFITPDLRFGGTNSSLSNYYSALKDDYDIDVFALYNKKIGDYSFNDKILCSTKLIYWYYSYFSDLHGFDKLGALFIKVVLHLCLLLKIDFRGYIQRREVERINQMYYYDIVIGFQEGSATQFAARFNKARKIAWIHCDYVRYQYAIKKNEEKMYQQFNKIICVSKYTASSFVDMYPSLSESVICLYNPYDKNRVLKLSKELVDDARFDTSVYTILSVGRIDHVKQFSIIPIVAKKLKDAGKEFKWYIIGNVVEKDEYHKLRSNIVENKMVDIVILLGGKTNPYPYFAKSNLFVSTSLSEACPIVFLEAQTFGLPIVTSNFKSSYEFIQNGINGYITRNENMHNCIINVMEGKINIRPVESIVNSDVFKCLKQVFSE